METYRDEMYTLENIDDRSGGVVSEQLIRLSTKTTLVPKL